MYLPPIYFNSKTRIVINDLCFNDCLNKFHERILSRISKLLSEDFNWITKSVDGDYVDIHVYNLLAGSSYKLLINIQNKENECFHWCHIKYLNPIKKLSQRIIKSVRKTAESFI